MRKLANYLIVALIFFEVIITCVAAYTEGWESKNVGIWLAITLITALILPTKKGVGLMYFFKSDFFFEKTQEINISQSI